MVTHTQYGAIPRRSTIDSLLGVRELISRLSLTHSSYFAFIGDATKAFDLLNRDKLWEALQAEQVEKSLIDEFRLRHNKVYYTSTKGELSVDCQATKGVAQGDPNGPVLFNVSYKQYGHSLDRRRQDIPKAMIFHAHDSSALSLPTPQSPST